MAAIWGKVYGSLHSSVKWRRATKGARALWTSAFSWSIAQGTDGLIPSDVLRVLDGTKAEAAKLVEVGLWEPVEGGWMFHDWLGHNHSDVQIQETRAATRERVQKHRQSKRNDVTPDSSNALHVTGRNTARTEQNREEQTDVRRAPVESSFQNGGAVLQAAGLSESERPEFIAWLKRKKIRDWTAFVSSEYRKGSLSGVVEDWRLDGDAANVRPAARKKSIHPEWMTNRS